MHHNIFALIVISIHFSLEQKVEECGIDNDTKTYNNIEMKNKLKSTVAEIKRKCGQVCDTNLESDMDGKYYKQLWKNIDCKAMFENPIFDEPSKFLKPLQEKHLPQSVREEFTYHGKLQIKSLYADNTKGKITIFYMKFLTRKVDI